MTEIKPRRVGLVPRRLADQLQADGPHERYRPEPSPHPSWHNEAACLHIRRLADDPIRNGLWLATWGGVLFYSNGRVTHHHSEHGLNGNATADLVVDSQGVVWAAGQGYGLSCLSCEPGAAWQEQKAFHDTRVERLTVSPRGGILAVVTVADEARLLRVTRPGARPRILLRDPLACTAVEALLFDQAGILWAGNMWGLHRPRERKPALTWDAATVQALALDRAGTIWIGTDHGLYHLKDGHPVQEPSWPREPICDLIAGSDSVYVLTLTTLGQLKDGSWYKGPTVSGEALCVHRSNGTEQLMIGGAEGLFVLREDRVTPAFSPCVQDRMGLYVQALAMGSASVWVGSPLGLQRFEHRNGHWQARSGPSPALHDVRALHVDGDLLWVGSWRNGLQYLRSGIYLPDPRAPREPITAITGNGETSWAAGDATLYRQKNESGWRPVALPSINGMIQSLLPEAGGLWLGSSAGLFYYDLNGAWHAVDVLGQSSVQALTLGDRLWIGTNEGLFDHKGRHYHPKHLGYINALLIDPEGLLWIGTATGLFSWHPKNPKIRPRRFTCHNSGLASDRITALAMTHSEAGYLLWIGTPLGLSRHHYPPGATP